MTDESSIEEIQPMQKSRKDKGQVRITDRDILLIKFVADQYTVHLKQLARINEVLVGRLIEDPTVRQLVTRWEKLGLVTAKKVYHKKPTFIWVTRKGLDLVGYTNIKATIPSEVIFNHLCALTEIRLMGEKKGITFKTERHIRSEQIAKAEGEKFPHVVDAEMTIDHEVYALEVDLTAKKISRAEDIMKEVLSKYVGAYYYVTSESRSVITNVLARLTEEQRKRVRVMDYK